MADNIAVTAGSGTTISTEEVTTLNGSVVSAQHTQRIAAAVVTANGIARDLLLGRNSDATSLSTALSTEDAALLADLLTITAFEARIPALGQALAAASVPVVLTAAQVSTLTPPAAISGFATSAKQDTQITAEQAILAKLIAAPATEAKQDTGNTSLSSIDGKIPALGQALAAASVPVILPSATITTLTPPAAITGFATSANQTTELASLASIDGKLVSGPSTAAKQDTGNTSLSSIDGKVPALGQALAAASVPVILPSATITTLTPPAAITGFATETTLSAQSAKLPAALGANGGLKIEGVASGTVVPVSDGGGSLTVDGTVAATQSGTWTVQPGNTPNTTPWLASPLTTAVDVALTRPSDTTTYAANDEISSSTTAPAVNTITSAARASGGTVRLRAASCVDSSNVATKAQLLVYIFDTTTTPNNDNAAFAPADSVLNTCVGILPFNIWYPGDDTSGATGNAFSPYLGPELDIKTVGSANLFFRVKVLNAYVPTSAEVLTFRFVFVQY